MPSSTGSHANQICKKQQVYVILLKKQPIVNFKLPILGGFKQPRSRQKGNIKLSLTLKILVCCTLGYNYSELGKGKMGIFRRQLLLQGLFPMKKKWCRALSLGRLFVDLASFHYPEIKALNQAQALGAKMLNPSKKSCPNAWH